MSEPMLKSVAKQILLRYFPDALHTYQAWRFRQTVRAAFWARQSRLKAQIYNEAEPTVLSGPFTGTTYLNETVWGPIEPKWLGTYEQELSAIIEQIIETGYTTVIDIGSAEGYYAVGLAARMPSARIYSYDIDPWARSQQLRLARLNGVKNLHVSKRCSGEELTARISGRTLLICDVEGYEYELLDPARIPSLGGCDILVELHSHTGGKGMTPQQGADMLEARFSAGHRISRIAAQPRSIEVLSPDIRTLLSAEELRDCVNEHRSPGQLWLWLEADRSSSGVKGSAPSSGMAGQTPVKSMTPRQRDAQAA